METQFLINSGSAERVPPPSNLITRRDFLKRSGGATVAVIAASHLAIQRVEAQQPEEGSGSCSFIGVIGTPAGTNYTAIQTALNGAISAKVQIQSSPGVGYGNSVTVMARVVIWITDNYSGTLAYSSWVSVTGWRNSQNCFQSGSNTGVGNFVGATPEQEAASTLDILPSKESSLPRSRL